MKEFPRKGEPLTSPQEVRAPSGTQLICKNWLIETPNRMILNIIDLDQP